MLKVAIALLHNTDLMKTRLASWQKTQLVLVALLTIALFFIVNNNAVEGFAACSLLLFLLTLPGSILTLLPVVPLAWASETLGLYAIFLAIPAALWINWQLQKRWVHLVWSRSSQTHVDQLKS
jgi:hypothetical protein